MTVGGEYLISPIGVNPCITVELPNLSSAVEQPSSSSPPLSLSSFNDAGDEDFIGVDNAVGNQAMANVVQQLPHPLDEGDRSVESGATSPDDTNGNC